MKDIFWQRKIIRESCRNVPGSLLFVVRIVLGLEIWTHCAVAAAAAPYFILIRHAWPCPVSWGHARHRGVEAQFFFFESNSCIF